MAIKLIHRAPVMFEAGAVIEPAAAEAARLVRVGLAEALQAPKKEAKKKSKAKGV